MVFLRVVKLTFLTNISTSIVRGITRLSERVAVRADVR